MEILPFGAVVASAIGSTSGFNVATIQPTSVFSDTSGNSSPTVPSVALGLREQDFKQYPGSSQIKRYWRTGKFFAGKGFGW